MNTDEEVVLDSPDFNILSVFMFAHLWRIVFLCDLRVSAVNHV
jgi:hypothetical protein